MGILLYALDRYGGSDWQRHCTQRSSVVFDRYDGGSSIYYCNDRCGRQ